jgi:UDP-GlcNAc:undecaprenyl-phosphate GlcNAc-1-phosphate transferase
MATALFFSFLGSLIICMALIPPLTASAGRLHILDLPGGRKLHQGSMAKVGGIALAAGTFIGVLMWGPRDSLITAGLLGGLTILLFGIWDDRVGLGYRAKFGGQALAVVLALTVGGVQLGTVPLVSDHWLSPWIGLPLTFLVLIAVTNAVNLADGLDGLAGGLSLVSFAGFAYLAFQADDAVVLLMVMSVLGGLLGFLRFNTYPAKIFMGDAGSQFLGFYLGITGLVLTSQEHGPYSPVIALFIWGLPLLDTAGVVLQRRREGRSPFVGDRNHLHHKLLDLGCSHRGAVVIIYAGQTAMVALGCGLRWQPDWMLGAVYLAVAALVLWPFLRTRPVLHARPTPQERAVPSVPADWARHHPTFSWLPVRLLAVAVPVFLFARAGLSDRIPSDAGLAAAGLFTLLAAGHIFRPAWLPFFVRSSLYLGSTFLLYLGESDVRSSEWTWWEPTNLFFVGVALLVALVMRLSVIRQFETTPLDSLIVLLALLLPFLPELHVGDISLSLLTAKLIALFFSFELLLQAYEFRIKSISALTLCLLGIIVIRTW